MGTFSLTERNKFLDALARNVVYSAPAVYIKLHTGDPGAAGTANPSSVTARPQATFTAAAAGTTSNSGTIEWTNWAGGAETVSWISGWSDPAAGTFLFSDDLNTPGTMTAGDTLRIAAGQLQLSET